MAGAKVVGGKEMERWWYSEETLPVLGWNTDSFSDMKGKKEGSETSPEWIGSMLM